MSNNRHTFFHILKQLSDTFIKTNPTKTLCHLNNVNRNFLIALAFCSEIKNELLIIFFYMTAVAIFQLASRGCQNLPVLRLLTINFSKLQLKHFFCSSLEYKFLIKKQSEPSTLYNLTRSNFNRVINFL